MDVLPEHGELARQVPEAASHPLKSRRTEDTPILPAHERMGAAARDARPDSGRAFAYGVAQLTQLGQQRARIIVHGRVDLDHRTGDFRLDAAAERMSPQCFKQLGRRRRQIECIGVDELELEFDAERAG